MKRGALAEGVLALLGMLILVTGYVYFVRTLPDASIIALGDIVYVFFAVVAAIFGILAVREYSLGTPEGKLLLLLTCVPLLDAIAGLVWVVYEVGLGILNPYPSFADGIWFLFYVAGISAFLYALNKVRSFVTKKNVLAAIIAWGLLVAIAYKLTLQPIFTDSESTLLLKFLSAMYPIGDIILGGLALLLFLSLKGSRLGDSWRTFAIAFWVYSIADLVYTYQLYAGTYQTGSITDIFWYAGQLIMALGFYQQIKLLRPR